MKMSNVPAQLVADVEDYGDPGSARRLEGDVEARDERLAAQALRPLAAFGEAPHVDQLEHVAAADGEESADLERPVVLRRGGEERPVPSQPDRSQQLSERSRAVRLLHGDAPTATAPPASPSRMLRRLTSDICLAMC